jgi:hypothetical protein
MKKLLFLQLAILFSCFSLMLHAQDSVKKTTVIRPAIVKPVKVTSPAYLKPKYPVKTKVDSAKGTLVYKRPAADTAKQNINTDKSLNGQYQYLLTKFYNYQQPLLGAFHKSIMDTLIQTRHALRDTSAKLKVANKTIDSLNSTIKSNGQTLSDANEKVNAIDFVGITMPKSTYNLIMWGLVIVFGVVAAVVISRSGAHSREAKYRTQLYNELEEEYRVYKAKANEKEKKLARELQTERNKLDELTGRSDS